MWKIPETGRACDRQIKVIRSKHHESFPVDLIRSLVNANDRKGCQNRQVSASGHFVYISNLVSANFS